MSEPRNEKGCFTEKPIKSCEIEVNDILTVHAGAIYHGKVTEIADEGFWLTEDYKTEEFISFADLNNVYKGAITNE